MPPIRKEKPPAGGVLAGGVEKKRKGPKPKPLSERVQSWTFDKPKTRLERSYTRERKIEVIMYLLKHKIPDVREYRRVARRRIGQHDPAWDEPERGADGKLTWFRAPTYAEAAEFWKIPIATISSWWESRVKILDGTGIELPKPPPPPPPSPPPPPPKPQPKTAADLEKDARLLEEQQKWLAARGLVTRVNDEGELAPSARVLPQAQHPVQHVAPVCRHPIPIQPAPAPGPPGEQSPSLPGSTKAVHVYTQPPPSQSPSTPVPAPAQAQAQAPSKPPFPYHVVYAGEVPVAGVFLQHPSAVGGYPPPSAGGATPWVVLYYGPPPGKPGGFPLPERPPPPPNGPPPNQPTPVISNGYAPPPTHQDVAYRSPYIQPPPPSSTSKPPPAAPVAPAKQPPALRYRFHNPRPREPFPGSGAFSTPPAETTSASRGRGRPKGGKSQSPAQAVHPPSQQPKASSLWPTELGTTAVNRNPAPSSQARPTQAIQPATVYPPKGGQPSATGSTQRNTDASPGSEEPVVDGESTASTLYATPESGEAEARDKQMLDASTVDSEED